MKDSRINLRISREKHRWLKKLAKKKKVSMTTLLEEYIDKLIKKERKASA